MVRGIEAATLRAVRSGYQRCMRPSSDDQPDESPGGFAVKGVIVVVVVGLAAMLAGLAFDNYAAGSWAAAVGFFMCCAAIFYARFLRAP